MSSPNRSPGGALHALIGQTSTGAGASHPLGAALSTFTLQGYVTTGSGSTAAHCSIEGCLSSGAGWSLIGGATAAVFTTTTKTKLFKSTNAVPVTSVRVRVKTWSTRAGTTAAEGGTVNAWIAAQY